MVLLPPKGLGFGHLSRCLLGFNWVLTQQTWLTGGFVKESSTSELLHVIFTRPLAGTCSVAVKTEQTRTSACTCCLTRPGGTARRPTWRRGRSTPSSTTSKTTVFILHLQSLSPWRCLWPSASASWARFEFDVPLEEIQTRKLDVAVKNNKMFYTRERKDIGMVSDLAVCDCWRNTDSTMTEFPPPQVMIDFSEVDLSKGITQWYVSVFSLRITVTNGTVDAFRPQHQVLNQKVP